MTHRILLDASGNLPVNPEDWYSNFVLFDVSSEADKTVLLNELKGLDPKGLREYCDRFPKLTNEPDLLLMVYAQPELVAKMDEDQIYNLLVTAYNKFRSKMIDQPLFEKMISRLISGYTSHNGVSFLPQLQFLLKSKVDQYIGFPVGPSFDKAMAEHLEDCQPSPSCQNDTNIHLSKLALAQVEMPQTLEVLVKQQMAIGAMDAVALMVAEYFGEFKKFDAYIDVFRRVLGDDVFTDLCVQTNSKKGSMASVSKLAPLLGEASFHNEVFFESLKRFDGKIHKSDYLAQLKYFPTCEDTLPILAKFLMENLESTLTQLADYGNQDFLRQVIRLAVRQSRGAEAFGYVIDAIRAPVSDASLVHAFEVSREELIAAMSKNLQTPQAHFQVKRAWYMLQLFTLDVGFKTVHEVLPGVDAFFLTGLLEERRGEMEDLGITVNHLQLIKMFPQIKGRLLEDALGL